MTIADRIRNMTDEELYELIKKPRGVVDFS